jgi:tripartite-type tricarboxylate transporter receptor subunit TctC
MHSRSIASGLVCLLVSAVLALGARTAEADDWPAKPVHIVVPFPAGGGTDVLQRYYANKLAKALNQTVVIENVGGASGAIGGARVARAAPDGYTILGTVVTSVTLLPHQQKLPYDAIGDFTGVARLSESVGYLGINRKTGITSLKELIDRARAEPGKYRYASAGVGSILELRMEELNHAAGIVLEHIPYQGGSAYLSDFIAGRVDIIADGSLVKPQVEKGVANIIATIGDRRTAEYPDVPTVQEIVAAYQAPPSWQVYLVPKGTPTSIVKRLAAEVRKISQEPDTAAFLANLVQVPLADDENTELDRMLRQSYDTLGQAAARLGLKK